MVSSDGRGGSGTRPWRRTGASLALRIAHTGLNFAVAVVLARLLGPAEYGVYAFALATAALLSTPMSLGMPMLLVREVAAAEVRGDWGGMRGLIRAAFALGAVVSLGLSITAGLGLWLARDMIQATEFRALIAALILVNLRVGLALVGSVLTGLNRVIAAQAPQFVINPVLVLALVGGAAIFAMLDAADALALSALATLLTLVLMSMMLSSMRPPALRAARAAYSPRAWLAALIPMTALAGVEIFSNQLDMFMLGVLSDKPQVGYYRVAFSGAALIILCRTVVDAALAPQIARLWQRGDRAELQGLIRWSSRLGLAAAAPVAGGLLLLGPSLIGLAYGEAYLPANAPMAALCLGQLINAWAGPARSVLQLTGHEREAVRGAILSGLINVVLNASLIPFLGALGAALATMIALAGVNMWLCRRLRELTGLRSTAL